MITSRITITMCCGTGDGAYRVEFWDTEEGRPVQATQVRAERGALVVDVPSFRRDLAFKIKPL